MDKENLNFDIPLKFVKGKIVNAVGMLSAIAMGGPGGAVPPLTTACAHHFSLLRILFWNIT